MLRSDEAAAREIDPCDDDGGESIPPPLDACEECGCVPGEGYTDGCATCERTVEDLYDQHEIR